jgi:transposase
VPFVQYVLFAPCFRDRDSGGPPLHISRTLLPFIKNVWADGGYNHARVSTATNTNVEIVKKPPDQVGFAVLPRRWEIERFLAWISRNRRLANAFEATINSAAIFRGAASVMLLVRRLARQS